MIVVGASAGGVEALTALMSGLPADFPAAVFVVLHLAPQAPSVLPRILSRAGPLKAVHPEDGMRIQRGKVYVALPDRHLLVEEGRVRLSPGPRENRHRPAVDPLFRTAVTAYDGAVLGVVLTGMGSDGRNGAGEIRAAGGTVLVQDQATSVVWGMPGAVSQAGFADEVLPLERIPEAITRHLTGVSPAGRAGAVLTGGAR